MSTKIVTKESTTDELLEDLVLPSGKSFTAAAGSTVDLSSSTTLLPDNVAITDEFEILENLSPKQNETPNKGPWQGARLFRTGYFGDSIPVDDTTLLFESQDGVNWTAMNGGAPVIDLSPASAAYCTSIVRYNNEWIALYIVGAPGSQGLSSDLGISRSKDLITWTDHALIDMSATGFAKTWSPSSFIDNDGVFYIYFNVATADTSTQTLYYTYATNVGLTAWAAPAVITVKGQTGAVHRDPFVIRIKDTYKLLWSGGGINVATSESPLGPWVLETSGNDGEAPWLVPLLDGSGYRLYFDKVETGPGDVYCDLSPDLKTGWLNYASGTLLTPANIHHPCILVTGIEDFKRQPVSDTVQAFQFPDIKYYTHFDDFIGGNELIGIGSFNWLLSGGAVTGVVPNSTDHRCGVVKLSTAIVESAQLYSDTDGLRIWDTTSDLEVRFAYKVSSLTDVKYSIGIDAGGGTVTTLQGIYMRIDPVASANMIAIVRDGSGEQTIDSGVAVVVDTWYSVRIRRVNGWTAISVKTGLGSYSAEVWSAASHTATGNGINHCVVQNGALGAKELFLDWFSVSQYVNR